MERKRFESLVLQVLLDLPYRIREHLDNVDVVVEDAPTMGQLVGSGLEDGDLMLGLYEGLPLTERSDYGMVLPDKISLFQKSIESICFSDAHIIEEVRATVTHEIAHHFGIDDESLEIMGA